MLDLTSAAATNTSTLQLPPLDAPVHMAATADPFGGGCRRESVREGPWGGGRREAAIWGIRQEGEEIWRGQAGEIFLGNEREARGNALPMHYDFDDAYQLESLGVIFWKP